MTLATLASGVRGHVTITSRWNYDEHLFPILQDRCGACHVAGGVAPFSLVEYEKAYSWAESIREEVLALRMPAWQAEDGFGRSRNGQALSVNEMDMILELSSGGSPQDPSQKRPPEVGPTEDWKLGEPHLALPMPRDYTLASETDELLRFGSCLAEPL